LSPNIEEYSEEEELEILLEAARRANWDALKGPRHLRTGRFRPEIESASPSETDEARDGEATRQVTTTNDPAPGAEG
jgi:hypothetical protein